MKERSRSDPEVSGRLQTAEYASHEEVAEAIHTLTDADYQKLMLIARYWHRQRYGRSEERITPDEILSDAIARTLDPAQRRWRKEKVSIIKHLDRVMESVSGHILESRVAETNARGELQTERERMDKEELYPRSIVEKQIVARQLLEIIKTLFVDNERALSVLNGRALEKTADETCVELGLSKTEYASVTKLILRRFIKHAKTLEKQVYPVPLEIDQEIARLKLASMGVLIDHLTSDQERYLSSWQEGT